MKPLTKGRDYIRDYVDDLVVSVRGDKLEEVAKCFAKELDAAKGWLKANNMELNDGKEQLFTSHEKLNKLGKRLNLTIREKRESKQRILVHATGGLPQATEW